jgi:signal transduction histidine kinase
VGPDNRVLHANPAARNLLALPPDPRGQSLPALIRHGELRRTIESAAREDVMVAEVAVDDRRLLVATRRVAQPGPEDAGRAGALVVTLVDLTQIRRLEGVRRDFVANVSHELKTPLTSIRGYVETLLSDDPGPEFRTQFLDVIRKNADRLQTLVDDLLDLSRIESGGWTPDLQDVDPARSAAEAWDSFADRARAARIEFVVLPAGPLVRADPSALRQVFGNLFDNAIRHTSPGGTITVAVLPPPHGDARGLVTIEVRDTGSGIPREALPRIFERFYRVDPARSRAEGGTGLGLSIVKHLTESMAGDASAASELGKGTTIRLRLPEALAADPDPIR